MINRETTIADILKTKKGEEVLQRHGLPCLSCAFAAQEIEFLKLGDVGEKYGLDVDVIIKEVNEG